MCFLELKKIPSLRGSQSNNLKAISLNPNEEPSLTPVLTDALYF